LSFVTFKSLFVRGHKGTQRVWDHFMVKLISTMCTHNHNHASYNNIVPRYEISEQRWKDCLRLIQSIRFNFRFFIENTIVVRIVLSFLYCFLEKVYVLLSLSNIVLMTFDYCFYMFHTSFYNFPSLRFFYKKQFTRFI
jgi:hypothetical protein